VIMLAGVLPDWPLDHNRRSGTTRKGRMKDPDRGWSVLKDWSNSVQDQRNIRGYRLWSNCRLDCKRAPKT
jgi:hypothetical protein